MPDSPDVRTDLPLFEGIPEGKIPHVLKCLNATVVEYGRGDRIFARSGDGEKTGYLCEGRAQLVSNDYWGNRSILGEYGPGSVVAAERFFKLDLTLPADVIACEPCTVLQFNLGKHVEAKPCCMVHVDRIRSNLARITIRMSAELVGKLNIVSMRSTREKILAYLTSRAAAESSATFDIPYSRQELADALYVERSALSHELSKLQKDGFITFNRRHFELHRALKS